MTVPINLSEENIGLLFDHCAKQACVPEDIQEYAKEVSVQIAMGADTTSLEQDLLDSILEILEEAGMETPEAFLKEVANLCKTAMQQNGRIDDLIAGGGSSSPTAGAVSPTKDGTTASPAMKKTTAEVADEMKGEKADPFVDQSLAKLMAASAASDKQPTKDEDRTPSTSSFSPGSRIQQSDKYVCRVPNLMLLYGGGKLLLKSATLDLQRGHRYGIVGKNGAGKTTLLTMIATGKIVDLPLGKYDIVSVQASVASSSGSVYEYAIEAFHRFRAAKEAQNTETAEEVVRSALEMVGFCDPSAKDQDNSPTPRSNQSPTSTGTANNSSDIREDTKMRRSWEENVAELSGGWRMRLSLAVGKIECAAPDILLLDEPTNHLDVNAVRWLAGYLTTTLPTKTAVLIVSHDAEFLEKVCTDVIHFENQKLDYYSGGFTEFRKALGMSDAEMQDLLQTMAHATGGGATGTDDGSAPQAYQRRPELDEADRKVADSLAFLNLDDTLGKEVPKQGEDSKWVGCAPAGGVDKLSFPIPGKLDGIANDKKSILELKNINFRYSETAPMVLENVNCRLTIASRVALEGANGAGKSTLLGLLSGELAPDLELKASGAAEPIMYKHRNLRLAYIAQHHTFHLQEFAICSPLVYMQKRFKNGYDEELQKRLLTLSPDEEQYVIEQAKKQGKYGKRVRDIAGRQKRGKEFYYEIQWQDLPDSKQNTFEPQSKLRQMGVENVCRAYDERQQAVAAGNDQRPLSNREILKHFENFGFDEDMVERRQLGSFSMGQKSRLLLAASMWVKPHCLFLDEPTNYIDQETLDALEKALKFFRGAVLIVSHNHDFLKRVCTEHWRVEDKKVATAGMKK
ncbi:unnamed protein product [Amoebophrya sp. A120]|nr:unnamed protein product [Amoebophrya sp. A120]|eukprot:GSA120T00003410001.1